MVNIRQYGRYLLLGLGFCCLSAQATDVAVASYPAIKVASGAITLDGKLNETAWQQAALLADELGYPWRAEPVPATRFQAVWDTQYLYFSFIAEDSDIVLVDKLDEELDIGGEDRVELFFAQSAIEEPIQGTEGCELPRYYGVEIDARGRVLDFSARYYRQFDFDWTMPGLETVAKQGRSQYQIEARIPLQSLRDLNLLAAKNTLMAGVFRGEFSHSGEQLQSRWISWINPETPQPDFHVTDAFGHFQLVE